MISQTVRTTWCDLLQHGLDGALQRFAPDLVRFNESLGNTSGYHDTITVAMLRVMADRLAACQRPEHWETFVASAPELLDWTRPVLLHHYSRELLFSDEARAVFVEPDRVPLP